MSLQYSVQDNLAVKILVPNLYKERCFTFHITEFQDKLFLKVFIEYCYWFHKLCNRVLVGSRGIHSYVTIICTCSKLKLYLLNLQLQIQLFVIIQQWPLVSC